MQRPWALCCVVLAISSGFVFATNDTSDLNSTNATDDENGTESDNATEPTTTPDAATSGPTAQATSSAGPGYSQALVPTEECETPGDFFNAVLQRCSPCTELDGLAVPATTQSCECQLGVVECEAGETCTAWSGQGNALEEFVAEEPLECRQCPLDASGGAMAPTRDRKMCMPCGMGLEDGISTLGYSEETGDCLCPPLHALVERGLDGSLLDAKQCILCSAEHFPGPQDVAASVYDCTPCPDPERMERNIATGECECLQSGTQDAVSTGGICIDMADFNQVNSLYPEASAIRVVFRDGMDENADAWQNSDLGQSVGIAQTADELLNALELGEAQAESTTIDSATFKWLYIRSAAGCLLGNATACQCISNLCVLALYEDQATVCRFVQQQLYEGRASVSSSTPGHRVGLPWIVYSPQPARAILEDEAIAWSFTLGEETESATTNTLVFWMAQYSLEGEWLGWVRLDSQLELCKSLGGYTEVPSSARLYWRRFGSSLAVQCEIPVYRLVLAGLEPTFYELFLENTDGTLVPVPVRILNTAQGQVRPNLNFATEDIEDDFLVRRFVLIDAVSGKEGSSSVVFDTQVAPRILRWAAHMTMQIKIRPGSDAQIHVPVLSIAYAEKEGVTLADTTIVPTSFTAEYAMDTGSFWTTTTVFFVLLCILLACLACFRAYLVAVRYPNILLAGAMDPGIFIPRFIIQALSILATCFTGLLWFHFIIGMYWFIIFKGQDVPKLLLPSAFEGGQYAPHDIMLVLEACFGSVCVVLGLAWHMKTFIFLLDWEKADPSTDHGHMAKQAPAASSAGRGGFPQEGFHQQHNPQTLGFGQMLNAGMQAAGMGGMGGFLHGRMQQQPPHQQMPGYGQPGYGQQQMAGGFGQQLQQGPPGYGGFGQGGAAPRPQMLGSAQFGGQPPQQEHLAYTNEVPDRGVSAWRSLFVCNELNERLASTRTTAHVTWLSMCLFLEGFGIKHWSRWYPGLATGEHMESAPYNPFLQFAVGMCTWLLIVFAQLLVARLSSIWLGHDLIDFVDVCAVANVSVFILDEPFHGYYIHGKAPSSKGDWCHTELAKAIHDESKGIGFTRGLTPESVQTFEMLLPPHLQISYPSGENVDFREHLYRTFMDIAATRNMIAQRTPARPTESDVAHLSMHRCTLSTLFDATIHAMMQAAREVIQVQTRWQRFWGAPPDGGVIGLRQPILFEDTTLLAWSSCLAHGSEIRIAGLGIPTGFEWHLTALEMLMFNIVWRFGDSIFLAAAVAFLLNRVVIGLYSVVARHMLSRTTIIDPMFLL